MGFIPLPLAVLATRIITQSVKISNYGSAFIFLVAFGCLVTFRILSNIITLGKACDLIDAHQKQRAEAAAIAAVAASTIDPPKGMSRETKILKTITISSYHFKKPPAIFLRISNHFKQCASSLF